MLFIVMKIVIARFQHCRGGRGFLIPVVPLVIVSKIAYQRMFQLFDPGVPRTFVEDCSYQPGLSTLHLDKKHLRSVIVFLDVTVNQVGSQHELLTSVQQEKKG